MRKNVLVFRPIPHDLLARIESEHDVIVADPRQPAQRPAFRAALANAHGLIGSSVKLGAAELAEAGQLEVISSISVGVDNYDLACLHRRGITLCHTPGVLTETTADTVFALIMATSRRLVELAAHVREGRWSANIGESLFEPRVLVSVPHLDFAQSRGVDHERAAGQAEHLSMRRRMAAATVAFPYRRDRQCVRTQQVIDDRGFSRTRRPEQDTRFSRSEIGRQGLKPLAEPDAAGKRAVSGRIQAGARAVRRQLHGHGLQRASIDRARVCVRAGNEETGSPAQRSMMG